MELDVSVVIPTYNGRRFVRQALESVFAQTRPPREIVVIDDCSTDDTTDVIQSIAKASPVPLRLIQFEKNCGGPAGPLNTGIAAASCELVAILEQDDLMAATRLEQQSAAALRHPECAIVIGRPAIIVDTGDGLHWKDCVPPPDDISQYFDQGEGESFVIPSAVAFRSLMKTNFIYSNSNVMLRRTCFEKIGGFDKRWPINSDADFEFRALIVAPIAVVDARLCGYRDRADSLYHSRNEDARLDGLLIRLKWGSRRWDWAHIEVQSVYWALRSQVLASLRLRDFVRAFRVSRALVASGLVWRHLLSRVGVGAFGEVDRTS